MHSDCPCVQHWARSMAASPGLAIHKYNKCLNGVFMNTCLQPCPCECHPEHSSGHIHIVHRYNCRHACLFQSHSVHVCDMGTWMPQVASPCPAATPASPASSAAVCFQLVPSVWYQRWDHPNYLPNHRGMPRSYRL